MAIAHVSGGAATSAPLSVLISPITTPTGAPVVNLLKLIDIDSLQIEETGNHGPATMSFNWRDGHQTSGDIALAYAQLRGPNRVLCSDSTGATLFNGYLGSPNTKPEGGNDARKDVTVKDISSRLDTLTVTVKTVRAVTETVLARVQWFMSAFAPSLVPTTPDWSKFTLSATFTKGTDDQTFAFGITVREGLEQIFGNASDSFQYFMDYTYRIWAWDNDNPRTFAAPFDITDTTPPGGGEVNPLIESFEFTWDTESLFTYYNVQAKKGPFNLSLGDNDQIPSALWGTAIDKYAGHLVLPGPSGVSTWGMFQRTLQAPDADSLQKSLRVLRAALSDTRNPVPRGTFMLRGTNALGWHGGQQVYVTSHIDGLVGRNTDNGPYAGTVALQPFGVARCLREFMGGGLIQQVTIDFGYRRPNLYTG